jgi:hypothetical protein
MEFRSALRSRAVVVASVATAALAGTGIALASSSGPSSHAAATPVTYFGCVEGTSQTLEKVRSVPFASCPKGAVKIFWDQKGPKGATGPQGPAGPQGPPGPTDLTVTATTNVSNRDEPGGNGNWATDTFVRTLTVTRHEATAVANCGGGVAECWYYTGTISDSGTFLTDAGAFTPNQGGSDTGDKISGTVAGNFTGGSAIEFYASSNAPNASLVPSAVSGDNPSTGDWYQQAFPSGTVFSGAANLINFSWTYNAPGTCEQWVDAYNNGGGQGSGAGNIAGINQCGG